MSVSAMLFKQSCEKVELQAQELWVMFLLQTFESLTSLKKNDPWNFETAKIVLLPEANHCYI